MKCCLPLKYKCIQSLSVQLMEDFLLQCRHKNCMCKCKVATTLSQKIIAFHCSCILLLVTFILCSQGRFLSLSLKRFSVLAKVLEETEDYCSTALQGLINLGYAILISKLVYLYLVCHVETTWGTWPRTVEKNVFWPNVRWHSLCQKIGYCHLEDNFILYMELIFQYFFCLQV